MSGASVHGLREHGLTAEHIPAALRLSKEAGWNQLAADWALMIAVGESFGLSSADGHLVATGLTLPYATRFGWIAMILVTASWRRRGLATHLMGRCVSSLLAHERVPGLDATPAGRQVYLRLGFLDIYRLTRYFAASPAGLMTPPESGVKVRPVMTGDLPAVSSYDRPLFGADREYLLQHLHARLPHHAFLAEVEGAIKGFVLVRDGQTSVQIGPLVADEPAIGLALLGRALRGLQGAVCIDVLDQHQQLRETLAAHGFGPQFPFVRMLHQRGHGFDNPQRILAIAGPELG